MTTDALFHHIDAYNDDELSDGAWWSVLENAVTFWNEEHKTHFDECDTVHAYLKWKGKQK